MKSDHFEKIFNEQAPIAKFFGMKLSFDEQQNAVIELPYNPNLNHAMGAIHGGVYATMLDSVGWFTAASHRKSDAWLTTSEMSIHFMKASKKTGLKAVGNLIKQGKRQDIVEMKLYNEEQELVGHAVATFVVLKHIKVAAK